MSRKTPSPVIHYMFCMQPRSLFWLSVVLIGQLRKVAACEAALERIVLEANEALGTLTCLGRTTSDQVMFYFDRRSGFTIVNETDLR